MIFLHKDRRNDGDILGLDCGIWQLALLVNMHDIREKICTSHMFLRLSRLVVVQVELGLDRKCRLGLV